MPGSKAKRRKPAPPHRDHSARPQDSAGLKRMGAYYTGEDIARYIATNTIIPCLLAAVARGCPAALDGTASIWPRLQSQPDRYLYQAARHGVIGASGTVCELPTVIARGINRVPDRSDWNRTAPAEHGLPSETWREYVARRERILDARRRLQAGEATTIPELVTLNLDLCQLALDAIAEADAAELEAWWQAMTTLRVLDPTCGLGAFLLAALNVLQPLYAACLDRLEQLGKAEPCPNRSFFIVRSILTNNLFGVDLMPEAVESCQQRLLAQLASCACGDGESPLNLDRNILCGNALVGSVTPCEATRGELISTDGKPFHWSGEFPQIMASGGFDVVIGNPPFVEYSAACSGYELRPEDFQTLPCGNLYAYVTERSCQLLKSTGWLGLILPAASVCTPRMISLEATLHDRFRFLWTSLWDERPAKLFPGVDQQLAIHLAHGEGPLERLAVTGMRHWTSKGRATLFETLTYLETPPALRVANVVPKLSSPVEKELLKRLFGAPHLLAGSLMADDGPGQIFYRNAGGRYWRLVKSSPSYFISAAGASQTSTETSCRLANAAHVPLLVALFSSSLYYWFWRVCSNCRHLTDRELNAFPVALPLLEEPFLSRLSQLAKTYEARLASTAVRQTVVNRRSGRVTQDVFLISQAKPILDEIDAVLAECYQLSAGELDFIVNYDIKYRLRCGRR